MTQIRPNWGELIPCSAAVTRLLFFSISLLLQPLWESRTAWNPVALLKQTGCLYQKAARNYSQMFFTGLLWSQASALLKPIGILSERLLLPITDTHLVSYNGRWRKCFMKNGHMTYFGSDWNRAIKSWFIISSLLVSWCWKFLPA